jgi:hypothetical protein
LWVVGREITLDDGHGPVTVWLQKLNPVEATTVARRSDAARARVMAVRFDEDSDEYQAIRASVLDYGDSKDELVNFLLMEDRGRLERVAEAKLASEDEWTKDNYLQGLRDTWNGVDEPGGDSIAGLKDVYAKDPENVEAKHVFDELKRFSSAISVQVEDELVDLREQKTAAPIEAIRVDVIERLIKIESNQAWLDELRRCEIFFGTRRPDNHKERVFTNRDEVDSLSGLTYRRLREAYEGMEVDVAEGKDLPAPPASSASSEPQNEEATVVSSGPVGALR